MTAENGKIEGDLKVDTTFTLNGMVTGSITVIQGGILQLHGMCCGDLIIEQGGIAIVNGIVVRNIFNQGTIEVRGIVNGNVSSKGAHYQQAPGAVVRGTVEA